MHRRRFILGGLSTLCLARPALTFATPGVRPALEVAATSPWLTNGVAVAADHTLFINFPRFKGHTDSPALARVTPGGPVPFPGNHWNAWHAGDDGMNTLVNVNAVHIFGDGLLWVVDQGAAQGEEAKTGAAKIIAFDTGSGEVKRLIRFDEQTLPKGGAPNDLRINGSRLYATDSGLGGIILHDLESGRTLRRLSGSALLRKPAGAAQKGFKGRILQDADGKRPAVHSDMLEVTADGRWLYVATPTGPLCRMPTAPLWDEAISDAQLEKQVQNVADIPSIGGTAIDSAGNLYLSNVENRSIDRLSPAGVMETLIQDDRLITPDALAFDREGRLYIPAPKIEYLSAHNQGREHAVAPWFVYRVKLA